MIPLLGYMIHGNYSITTSAIVFFMGICTHIWGFALNDVIDTKIDEKTEELKERPMVSGEISPKHAWFSIIFFIFLTFAVSWYLGKTETLLFIIISSAFGLIYDFLGKKIYGSDYFISLWAFFLYLAGYSVAGKIDNTAIYSGLIIFFNILVFNTVGNLKDIKGDIESKSKTTAIMMKCKIKDERLYVSGFFIIYIYALQSLLFISLINFYYKQNDLAVISLIIIYIFTLAYMLKIMRPSKTKKFDKKSMWKNMAKIVSLNFGLSIIPFILIIGRYTVFIFLLPIIWYPLFVYLEYGRMVPAS